jgi:hypothetical protein
MSSTVQYKGHTIKIEADQDPSNPRGEDFDYSFGTIVAFHKRHSLSDKKELSDGTILDFHDYKGWNEMIAHVDKVEGGIVWLPLYLYDHSGITISTTPFSCQWDSGQVGFIYVSKKKARETYSCKRIDKKRIETIKKELRSEITLFDDYLTGSVYGYTVLLPDGTEGDSCWGYYGSDHDLNGLIYEAQNAIDYLVKRTEAAGVQQELALA